MRAVVITKYGDPDVLSAEVCIQIRFRVLTTFLVSNFQARLNRVEIR
jgi:hypothetical protein